MATELTFTSMRKLVKDVSNSTAREYPPYITSEDVEGFLWLHMYERKSNYVRMVQAGDWEAPVAGTLRKVATDYCQKEKASVEGYATEDMYRYSIPKIRSLLLDVFDYEDWQSFGLHGDGQPVAKVQANETGDRIAELSDVKRALEELDEDTYNLILWHYKYDFTAEMLAEEFGIGLEAAKKRIQRSAGAIQKVLGRKTPEDNPVATERRTVRSNASWLASQSNQYDG